MISEEQLTKWEHQIDIGTLNCYQAVPKLIAEVRELGKEAGWLAEQCQTLSGYSPILRQGLSKNQWREAARRAVEDASS